MSVKKQPAHKPVDQQKLIELYRKALLSGMSLDKLESSIERHLDRLQASDSVESDEQRAAIVEIKQQLPLVVRIGAALVPVVLILVGVGLIGSAVVPIAGHYITQVPQLQAAQLTSPIPEEEVMELTPVTVADVSETRRSSGGFAFEPEIVDVELDYTNLQNWFTGVELPTLASGKNSEGQIEYTIDIPKLKIFGAKVVAGGTDLTKGIIAYEGTALPGDFGAPVLFGHSTNRAFYNPSEKNPRRYMSIFSYIMTLENNDEIIISMSDGIKYTYVVQEKTEVKPTDVHILTQKYDAKSLKLVTCTPEGTYLRRGVVTAQLVSQS